MEVLGGGRFLMSEVPPCTVVLGGVEMAPYERGTVRLEGLPSREDGGGHRPCTRSTCAPSTRHRHASTNAAREIGILLPNNQRQHRTLYIQEDALPYALCYAATLPTISPASRARYRGTSLIRNRTPLRTTIGP